jgi:hypothetical protein
MAAPGLELAPVDQRAAGLRRRRVLMEIAGGGPVAFLPRMAEVLRDACGLEQRLRGLEVGGSEPLGKAGVDRGQEVTRGGGPSLPMP